MLAGGISVEEQACRCSGSIVSLANEHSCTNTGKNLPNSFNSLFPNAFPTNVKISAQLCIQITIDTQYYTRLLLAPITQPFHNHCTTISFMNTTELHSLVLLVYLQLLCLVQCESNVKKRSQFFVTLRLLLYSIIVV